MGFGRVDFVPVVLHSRAKIAANGQNKGRGSWREIRTGACMAHLSVENEYDELYKARKIRLMWRLSRGWSLICASIHAEWTQVELFTRRDQPGAPPHVGKLIFQSEQECDDYLVAKRLELESEGWRDETAS